MSDEAMAEEQDLDTSMMCGVLAKREEPACALERGGASLEEHDVAERPLVTVIMPVYNSVEYLSHAAGSVLDTEFEGFELLLVDDGSTDGSGELCDRLAEGDRRVRVIHKANGGMCQSRNKGMDEAHGRYVMFCDNDDEVLPGFVEDNWRVAEETGADCVRFGREMRRISADGRLLGIWDSRPASHRVFKGEEILANVDEVHFGSDAVWAGLYRLSFLREHRIRFDESFRSGFEDTLFNDMVMAEADVYAHNPRTYYVWYRREGHSTSTRQGENRFVSLAKVLQYEYDLCAKASLLDRMPDWCCDWHSSKIRDCFTISCYSSHRSYREECVVYETLRTMTTRYHGLYTGRGLRINRLLVDLMIRRQYLSLYVLVWLGVNTKKLGRAVGFGGRR